MSASRSAWPAARAYTRLTVDLHKNHSADHPARLNRLVNDRVDRLLHKWHPGRGLFHTPKHGDLQSASTTPGMFWRAVKILPIRMSAHA